jgi:hypothetical protein
MTLEEQSMIRRHQSFIIPNSNCIPLTYRRNVIIYRPSTQVSGPHHSRVSRLAPHLERIGPSHGCVKPDLIPQTASI